MRQDNAALVNQNIHNENLWQYWRCKFYETGWIPHVIFGVGGTDKDGAIFNNRSSRKLLDDNFQRTDIQQRGLRHRRLPLIKAVEFA